MKYILNANFLYDSDNDTLSVINNPEIEIALTITASKIFHVLLENSGRDMSRETLLDILWSDYKIHPSGNSLSQYISILRKALIDIGCETQIIVTIPKIGFCIPRNVVSQSTSNMKLLTVPMIINEKKSIFAAFIILAIVSSLLFAWIKSQNPYIKNMYELTQLNGCSVYKTGNESDSGKEVIIKEINNLKLTGLLPTTCEPGGFYVSSVENAYSQSDSGRIFIAQCSRLNKSNLTNCISIYENKN
jgi:DNA-binding winged-HTH domains